MGQPVSAQAWAKRQVAAVRDDPAGRLALLRHTYDWPSPRRHLRYRRAALSFMRWQAGRGVLAAPDANPAGSAWWRAINERLLHDGCEAVARARGMDGERSSATIPLWERFVAQPTARSWYRAHNASVVAAYLENAELARAESDPERFFMNLALVRVLYAHALVAEPRLSLGRFAAFARPLGDPRLGVAGAFLSLARVLPESYPLDRELTSYLRNEHGLGRMLDYGVITPRLADLYAWSARELHAPGLLELLREGTPVYAWPYADVHVWSPQSVPLPIRVLRRATAAR